MLPQGEFLPLLAMPERVRISEWVTLSGAAPSRRRRALVVGVDDALERARLLRLGFEPDQAQRLADMHTRNFM